MKMSLISLFSFLFLTLGANARVYKNVKAGDYKSVIDLKEYKGQPFFKVMKEVIYPEINNEARNRSSGSHLTGIKKGEGVEIVLTEDVTTYHVKYKADTEDKVERSGRSFGAVGKGRVKKYVADASYKHYLRTLEKALESNDQDVANFFTAILSIITDSDSSHMNKLDLKAKQVAADFIAIYVAEQYRRLTATKGRYLGRSHQWDDALMQVTLLSAFHSGQREMKMYYEGEFTDKVYHQSECLYKASRSDRRREEARKREAKLYDYWQFTVRSECPGRSGVNLTRRDFEKLGKKLTEEILKTDRIVIENISEDKNERNIIEGITENLLNGDFKMNAKEYTSSIVEALMLTRVEAEEFSESFLD